MQVDTFAELGRGLERYRAERIYWAIESGDLNHCLEDLRAMRREALVRARCWYRALRAVEAAARIAPEALTVETIVVCYGMACRSAGVSPGRAPSTAW